MNAVLFVKMLFMGANGFDWTVCIVNVSNFEALTDEQANGILQTTVRKEAAARQRPCICAEWISAAEAAKIIGNSNNIAD